MGTLVRLRNLRIGRDEIVFIVLSVGLYLLSSWLPKSILADVCLGASIAVKVFGLPDQLRKMARSGDVEGQSLLRNVIDYQSYVLWAMYARAIHSPVLFWGQFPGAILVGLITMYHLRHGSFPWKRRLNKLGHLSNASCYHCVWVYLRGRHQMDPASPEFNPECRLIKSSPFIEKQDVPEGQSEWPRPCPEPGCPGHEHVVEVFPRVGGGDFRRATPLRPGVTVECDSCDHRASHFDSTAAPRMQYCCWFDSPKIKEPAGNEPSHARQAPQPDEVAALWLVKRGSRPTFASLSCCKLLML